MSRARLAIAALFAVASLALAVGLTGLGLDEPTAGRLARAGSPVSLPIIALIVVLVVSGIAFLIVGQKRRTKGE